MVFFVLYFISLSIKSVSLQGEGKKIKSENLIEAQNKLNMKIKRTENAEPSKL